MSMLTLATVVPNTSRVEMRVERRSPLNLAGPSQPAGNTRPSGWVDGQAEAEVVVQERCGVASITKRTEPSDDPLVDGRLCPLRAIQS